ncbi:MAG: c-type cytochrome [Rubrivivax sp.]
MKKSATLAMAAVAAATLTASGGAWADPQAAMQKAGCLACHSADKKIVGPSFKDISAKYKGHPEVVATLMAKVRKGGSGVFGPIPMAPNPPEKISDADLKAAIELILKS